MEFLLPIVLIVIVLSLLKAGRVVWKRRSRDLSQLADSLGLEFSAEDPIGLPVWLGYRHTFFVGGFQEASNVMGGAYRGVAVTAFDYRCGTSSEAVGDETRILVSGMDRRFSACIHTLVLPFPDLLIRPREWYGKAADLFGIDLIEFESDEFSQRFCVAGYNRKFAYAVCHPRMMEWLLADSGWCVEIDCGVVIVTNGRRWKPAEFRRAMDVLTTFLDMIPDFIQREYSGGIDT